MLDIANLERRWLRYKIKSFFPYALVISLVIISGFIIPLVVSHGTSSKPPVSLKKSDSESKTPLPSPVSHYENSMILEPSMQFLQSMNVPSASDENKNAITIPTTTSKPRLSEPKVEPVIHPPIVKPLQVPVEKGKLTSIKRDDTAFDIHELEERFKNNSNPNLGLYIARYHYDHGNYPESYNYALKTNAINSTMDESWLIFAKSLVKLGKEDQAKKTLQLYISKSNSQSAKNYLDTLHKDQSKW